MKEDAVIETSTFDVSSVFFSETDTGTFDVYSERKNSLAKTSTCDEYSVMTSKLYVSSQM